VNTISPSSRKNRTGAAGFRKTLKRYGSSWKSSNAELAFNASQIRMAYQAALD
jgi:hypothetical protein